MKNTILATLTISCLASSIYAQSLVNWNPTTLGNTTGTGSWASYGTVTWNIDYFSNSNGIRAIGNVDGPYARNTFESDLDIYANSFTSSANEGIGVNAGTVDGTNNGVGYTLTFTFNDGSGGDLFPALDTLFYMSDIESGSVMVEAFNNGVSLDLSSWYNDAVQTTATPSGGAPPSWDGVDTLNAIVPAGSSAAGHNFWVNEFQAAQPFDELKLTISGGINNDSIYYGIGDVTAVPEASSTFLLGLGGLGLLVRRKRV